VGTIIGGGVGGIAGYFGGQAAVEPLVAVMDERDACEVDVAVKV